MRGMITGFSGFSNALTSDSVINVFVKLISDCSESRSIVISTDGICAWWLYSAVRYYVRQKWRNLKTVAGRALAEPISFMRKVLKFLMVLKVLTVLK